VTALSLLGSLLASATAVGWFYRRGKLEKRRGRRSAVHRDIADAGSIAWKRAKARQEPVRSAARETTRLMPKADIPRQDGRVLRFAHPLSGPIRTAHGQWVIVVLKDEDDGRTRRFILVLSRAGTRPADAVRFVVRVPRQVIEVERAETWPADLRTDLAHWINANVIDRGEMIWWPNLLR
jgi:hypothetical protein